MQRHAIKHLLLITGLVFTQAIDSSKDLLAQSEFDAFKAQENAQFEAAKDEFNLYKQQLLAAFDQYKNQVSKVWGEKNTVIPDNKNWVSFQGDLNHRSVVDFEKGTVDVEIAVPVDQDTSDTEMQKQLTETIVNTLKQGADKRSVIDIAKQPIAQPSGSPVLSGQVADSSGNPADESAYTTVANQAANNMSTKSIKGKDGKARTIYRAQLKLVPNHIQKRAKRFQSSIELNSHQQKIPAAMVFAIMETESMFNPTARSPVPAFGLMQLVPTSGAREAYRYLYKKDRIVSDSYLYKPDNNIKLGTAYLNRLYFHYLNRIKDPESRKWATIAAYNTGPGNVFRTFAGKYKKSRFGSRQKWKNAAFYEINKMTPEQVYNHMRKQLPYRETRNYIQKVRSRITKYQAI